MMCISAESTFRIVCNFLKEAIKKKTNNFTRGIFVIFVTRRVTSRRYFVAYLIFSSLASLSQSVFILQNDFYIYIFFVFYKKQYVHQKEEIEGVIQLICKKVSDSNNSIYMFWLLTISTFGTYFHLNIALSLHVWLDYIILKINKLKNYKS